MLGAGAKRSKPLEAAIGNGQKSTEPADDILSRNPFLRDEELTDIEGFLKNFPRLHEYYIPVQIIGEGTFSTVYKAIDVKYYEAIGNERWEHCSRQDREDAMRFFAHIQRVQNKKLDRRIFAERITAEDTNGGGVYDPHRLINRCLLAFTMAHLSLMEARNDPLVSPRGEKLKSSLPETLPRFVALKRINPTSSPERLEDELSFIYVMGGKANVLPLITGLRFEDQVIAVFPYFSAPEFRVYTLSIVTII